MIKTKFREDVLKALAAFDRLTGTPLVGVDDLDAIAGPSQRDGHVGQRILPRGRLLVLEHLLRTRLADIDDGLAIEMMVADFGRAQRQQVGRYDDRPGWGNGHWRSGGAFRRAHGRPPSAPR